LSDKDNAIPADSFASPIAFAMSQPEDVDVNEILYRPSAEIPRRNIERAHARRAAGRGWTEKPGSAKANREISAFPLRRGALPVFPVNIRAHAPVNTGQAVQVLVRDNNVDQALKALKKKMQREGIFREMKLRGHYEKPSEKRAREKAEAVRRARKLARKKLQREGLLPVKPRPVPGPARSAG